VLTPTARYRILESKKSFLEQPKTHALPYSSGEMQLNEHDKHPIKVSIINSNTFLLVGMEQQTRKKPTEELLDTIGDEMARRVLIAVSKNPQSAKGLAETCDMSLPTVYRRVDVLMDHGLITEQTAVADDGTTTRSTPATLTVRSSHLATSSSTCRYTGRKLFSTATLSARTTSDTRRSPFALGHRGDLPERPLGHSF
jgi:DNA-binding transcriptional ArsR family regulator